MRCPACGSVNDADARFCDGCGRPLVADAERTYLVGRDPSADLVLDIPTVSARHLSVRRVAGGYEVRDLGSSNGTFLNDPRNRVTGPVVARDSDVLFLGSYRLPMYLVAEKLGLSPGRMPVTLRMTGAPMVLGRAEDCDLVLPFPQVSAHHARVVPQPDGSCLVEDLGSSNGTYVDGVRVRRAVLRPGGTLHLASVPVVLQPGRILKPTILRGTVRVDAVDVSRTVVHRVTGAPLTLLDRVRVSIYPSEMVGIMGPSGAGKTTLLLALNGYEPPQVGRVLLAGEDFYANFDRFRGLVGYVPQDDIIHNELTVRESLYYTARLRLPEDTTDAEIERRIERILADLKLADQADQVIGSVEDKVLSGGQRKRVNLAQELITDPEVLFLDEPTSGLSAKDAADVMDVLRGLADRGRTVVVTIHQPSAEVYRKMDHVLLLARGGRVAFFGPTEPDSYEYMGVPEGERSPDRLLSRLDTAPPEEWALRYEESPQCRTYVHKRLGTQPGGPGAAGPPSRSRASTFSQFVTLFRRYATIKGRDRTNAVMMALQAPIVGGLMAWLFRDARDEPLKRGAPLFILVIAAIFFSCFNACREVVRERAIFRRERMVTLRIGPYLMSKFAFLGMVDMAQVAVMLGLVSVFVGLDGAWGRLFVILGATALAGTAMGLLLSTLVKSAEAAMAMVPMVLIPQIVLGGFMVPLDRKDVEVPAALMLSRWATEAVVDTEAEGIEKGGKEEGRSESRALPAGLGGCDCSALLSRPTFRKTYGDDKHLTGGRFGTDLAVITGFLVVFLVAAGTILSTRDRR